MISEKNLKKTSLCFFFHDSEVELNNDSICHEESKEHKSDPYLYLKKRTWIWPNIMIITLFCFLIFNFPKALIFLGDGGSYLFGSLTVLNVIKTNNLNPEISSFFFCILLFYLFFEIFFSFFCLFYLKKSPLKPDKNHLHMLSYRWLGGKAKFNNCNYLNSLAINFVYLFYLLY